MINYTSFLNIGPMASVAGAIAEYVGRELLNYTPEIIVENGGDIFVRLEQDVKIGLYAGSNHFINDFFIFLKKRNYSFGIASSSSRIGHSLSLGNVDLATVISKSAALSDALATRLGNMVKVEEDIKGALEFSKKIEGVEAGLIVKDKNLGFWGLELRKR